MPHHRQTPRRPRRPPLGQHFLADPGVRQRILGWLAPRPDDAWLEIGAGHGEFTKSLAESSAAVIAIERDARLAAHLRRSLEPHANAQVVEADILKLSLEELARGRRLRVYGSLPYYITSPILQKLFQASEDIADVHIIIQREVAERLVARPGSRDYGYLSALTQLHAAAEILEALPRSGFRPPPRVDSALVRLVPPGARPGLGLADREDFLRFLQACFRHKRKTLVNNLRPRSSPAALAEALAAMGRGSHARAEELSLEQLAKLYLLLRSAVVRPRPL